MADFWGRVTTRDGQARVGPGAEAPTVAGVVAAIESGEAPAALASRLGVGPLDVLAAVAFDALSDPLGLPLVRSTPRRPKLADVLTEGTLTSLLPDTPRPARLGFAAGLLQACDFWNASHEAAQQADDLGERAVSPYWHGIAHRREPDAGNASYWFRRVGNHALFPEIAATDLGAAAGRLAPGGRWDPYAFVELCTRARGADVPLARSIQRAEMWLLMRASAPG